MLTPSHLDLIMLVLETLKLILLMQIILWTPNGVSYLLGLEDIISRIFESAPTGNPDDLEDFTGDYSEPEWLYDITIGLIKR